MIALAVSDVAVVATFALFALGLGCLLHDAWRHDRDAERQPVKRAVNRARLARLHVIEDARPVRATPTLERLPRGYRSPDDLVPGDRLVDGFWTKPDGRVWTGSEWL